MVCRGSLGWGLVEAFVGRWGFGTNVIELALRHPWKRLCLGFGRRHTLPSSCGKSPLRGLRVHSCNILEQSRQTARGAVVCSRANRTHADSRAAPSLRVRRTQHLWRQHPLLLVGRDFLLFESFGARNGALQRAVSLFWGGGHLQRPPSPSAFPLPRTWPRSR